MRRLVFRADASREIGYGHKVRSHALADMLSCEFRCVFPCEEGLAAEDFVGSLSGDEIVVLDNYFYDEAYELSILEKGCRLVRVNDYDDAVSKAEIILNPSGGMGWAMLREPFMRNVPEGPRPIDFIVSFGGSDPLGLTARYVEYLKSRVPGCRVETLSGLDAEGVAAKMRSCKAVVCSASSVAREALACGCRVLAGWYVDNQQDSYRHLMEDGLTVPLGDLRNEEISFDPFAGKPASIDFSKTKRRYLDIFRALSYEIVNYVDLSPERSRAVWEARNHPDIRRRMTNAEPFSFESHSAFIERLKTDTSKMYLAFFLDGDFVGSYDIVGIRDASAEHGLFVAPGSERRGIGSIMEHYADALAARRGIRVLKSEVLNDNPDSLNYHLKTGYSVTGNDDRFTYLERKI